MKNKLTKTIIPSILLLSVLFLWGCKKEPGVGGNASISGKVIVRKYNATFTSFLGEYPAQDHYVYIVYGEHSGYDSRIKTDYEGNYQFRFLYPGKYTVYTYSLDSTGQSLSGQIVVKQVAELNRKEAKVLSNMQIHE